MTVDYKEYRRKRLITEIKTCKAWMRKIATGFAEISDNPESDYRVAELSAFEDRLGELIDEVEKEQGK